MDIVGAALELSTILHELEAAGIAITEDEYERWENAIAVIEDLTGLTNV